VNDVIARVAARAHGPDHVVDIVRGSWSTHLDPMCYDGDTDRRNARVVIDACKPFARRDSFRWWRARAASLMRASRRNGRRICRRGFEGRWESGRLGARAFRPPFAT
jgi:hypothetical protein